MVEPWTVVSRFPSLESEPNACSPIGSDHLIACSEPEGVLTDLDGCRAEAVKNRDIRRGVSQDGRGDGRTSGCTVEAAE
jgi:hypothetical protein